MKDVIYHYVANENLDETELRYSIRSICKNLKFNNLFIRGDLPTFAKDITHINLKALENTIKPTYEFRHIAMLAGAWDIINDDRISDDFYWMNDDIYVMKPYEEFPYYYSRTIKEIKELQKKRGLTDERSKAWHSFVDELYEIFPNGDWYETHTPVLFNKQKLKALLEKYNIKHVATIRSYYANEYRIKGIQTHDFLICTPQDIELYQNAPFLSSINSISNHPEFKVFMEKHFPNPCKYEKDES